MSNSFILRPGQTVTVDFGAEPTPADFARLIAILELQRALAAGEPIEFEIDVKAHPRQGPRSQLRPEDVDQPTVQSMFVPREQPEQTLSRCTCHSGPTNGYAPGPVTLYVYGENHSVECPLYRRRANAWMEGEADQ